MKLSLQCAHTLRSFVAQDDDGLAFLRKHDGEFVTGDFSLQRSPQHNRMFWNVAAGTFANLPAYYADEWHTRHDMVKGLELAFGITDQVMKPTKGGWEIVKYPKSLDFGNMKQDEFNHVSEKLFKGMAHCIGTSVQELLEGTS
jgi:hypothetical protein